MALSRLQICCRCCSDHLSNLWLGPGAFVGVGVDRYVRVVGRLIFAFVIFVLTVTERRASLGLRKPILHVRVDACEMELAIKLVRLASRISFVSGEVRDVVVENFDPVDLNKKLLEMFKTKVETKDDIFSSREGGSQEEYNTGLNEPLIPDQFKPELL